MENAIGILLTIGSLVFMLGLGYFVGGWRERSHIQDLDRRESGNGDFVITQVKTAMDVSVNGPPPTLLIGEAVIASDYLKTFLASLRNLFGGEVRSYRTLMERARREALQRIVEQARQAGYNAVCNVRMQAADVGGSNVAGKKAMVMAAILVSATAYRREG
ncbi:YbjQ family protein [Aeoliella sp. ICT_H6.2]|uniref:YbjQ family protein n=1 Tax=Aeoliella straminimaris TaxID=2954799 RepID=A0A9X2FEJ3_9BACT|nr:heavy metal-binding domain-containing protein [Aeoliella straminimaris]MCO6047615.1 YbjQ family protein [Aeoliella straminimaris]